MHYFIFILFFIFGCGSEVSIMKTYETDPNENETDVTTDTYEEDTQNQIDTGTSNNNFSNTVGFVEVGLIQAACPYCLGLPQEINTKLKVRLHDPATASHYNWIPLPGTPCREYYESSVTAQNKDVGSIVTLKNDFGDNINLSKAYDTSGVIYENTYLTDSNFRRNSSYTLDVNSKTADNVISSLRGFDYIEPYTMLYVDPSYAFQAPIKRNSDNVFTWGPSGDQNSFFTIHVSVYSYDGSIYYGTVICASEDVGYMAIPGQHFQSYQAGNLTSIHLMRHKIDKKEYPDFEGSIEGHSWWEVIGTGYIQ